MDYQYTAAASPAVPVLEEITTRTRKNINSKKYQMRVEGHRGAGYMEPENSIKAFTKAIEVGIDGVELDVWLTKDNVPIVAHGLDGGIIEFTNELREVIGEINSRDLTQEKYTLKNGEKIPTFADVLDCCKDKVCINIELKETREEVIEKVLDLLQEKDMVEQITFSSFHHNLRRKLTEETEKRNLAQKVPFGFIMRVVNPKLPDYETECFEGDSLNVDIRYLENHREDCLLHLRRAKERQMTIGFWFPMEYVHENTFYDELLALEIDTLITNVPTTAVDYFAHKMIGQEQLGF